MSRQAGQARDMGATHPPTDVNRYLVVNHLSASLPANLPLPAAAAPSGQSDRGSQAVVKFLEINLHLPI